MIGIFDSGEGAYLTLDYFRRYNRFTDAVILADKRNAPFGTKRREELISIVGRGIERLCDRGAERVLLACCTASTVYEGLTEYERKKSIPIIDAIAKSAIMQTKNSKIAILSTIATKNSGEFVRAILRANSGATVESFASQELVCAVEAGASDTLKNQNDIELIASLSEKIRGTGADTLILGCTHFGAFEQSFKDALGINIINSARVGAGVLLECPLASEGGLTFTLD